MTYRPLTKHGRGVFMKEGTGNRSLDQLEVANYRSFKYKSESKRNNQITNLL